MAVPISQLLCEYPTSPVKYTSLKTGTDKKWARDFHPITKLVVHTTVDPDGETVLANWDALLPPFTDDGLRGGKLAFPANRRLWRLETEEDCRVWFHTEVSNIVLAAWNDRPTVLQTSQSKPPSNTEKIPEMIDAVYALTDRHLQKRPLAVGEWKRNVISKFWQAGRLPQTGNQANLSRELRGYAVKYQCPQVFCFDGELLLLLQFRAAVPEELTSKDCQVDCWVLPRLNTAGGCPLRYAFYRLLAQGLRRCQGLGNRSVSINGFAPESWEWFSGRSVFQDIQGRLSYEHPQNTDESKFHREVNVDNGSFHWYCNGQPCVDANGVAAQDTEATWGFTEPG